MLDKMLQKQKELQERLGYDFSSMTREEITAYIKEYEADMEEARKEFIDMFHFVLNIALALGMSDKDIYYMYMEKNEENHRRQDEGYTR